MNLQKAPVPVLLKQELFFIMHSTVRYYMLIIGYSLLKFLFDLNIQHPLPNSA